MFEIMFEIMFESIFELLEFYECDPNTPGCIIEQELYKKWLHVN